MPIAQGGGLLYDEFGDRFRNQQDSSGRVEDGAEESGESEHIYVLDV